MFEKKIIIIIKKKKKKKNKKKKKKKKRKTSCPDLLGGDLRISIKKIPNPTVRVDYCKRNKTDMRLFNSNTRYKNTAEGCLEKVKEKEHRTSIFIASHESMI